MKNLCFFLGLSLLFISCATEAPQGKTPAENLYREAVELMDAGRYIMATEKLNTIKSQYPYSYYTTASELLLSDILFLQETYVEAAASYLLFKDFHPKHKKIDYVTWKIAESYFEQMPQEYDRDLSTGREAIKYYRELIANYPQNEHVKQAREKIKICQDLFEKKEKYIADFYFKTEKFQAASIRYQNILNSFKTKDLLEHSKLRVVDSERRQGKFKECIAFANQFLSTMDKQKSALQEVKKLCERRDDT